MNENSPIRAGFAVVNRDPVIAAIEIAWRWTFGLIGTILLLLGTHAFLIGLKVSEGDEQALRGRDPTLLAAALMHILQQGGVLQRFFAILAAVAIPSAVIWVAAATLGRAATLRRLMPASSVNVGAILRLTIARAALLVAAVIAWYVWMVVCGFITLASREPNYALYILLSLMALPVIAVVWGVLNWILSLAPVLATRNNSSAWKSYSDTVRLVRHHRGEFTSLSSWLGLPRLAAMVIALMVAVVVLVATDSMAIGTVALTILMLAYCAVADYLYVVRLAAYVALEQSAAMPAAIS